MKFTPLPIARKSKPRLEVFDPAMCCSTGVCGPQVDPALVRFAADIRWIEKQGAEVRRFNLAQNPAAFVENEVVSSVLIQQGEAALPVVLVNGIIASTGRYPDRRSLASLLGVTLGLPLANDNKSCDGCGGQC